jgi:hypothetical protein
MFADVAISANIFVSGLAITIGWITGIVSINLFHIIGSIMLGFISGLVVIFWETSRAKSIKTKKSISFYPHNIIQGILFIGILLVPIDEVRFNSLIAYFGYHIVLLVALLLWQRQGRKRFQWIDLYP